jgi:hypothetical protein
MQHLLGSLVASSVGQEAANTSPAAVPPPSSLFLTGYGRSN